MQTKILVSILLLGLLCDVQAVNYQVQTINPLDGYQGQQSGQQDTTPKCINGYGWNGQVCVPCLQVKNGYCTCSAFGQCTTKVCNNGYQYLKGNGKKSGAEYEYIFNTKISLCLDPVDGCKEQTWDSANTSLVCKECNTDYQMIANVCVKLNNCAQMNYVTGTCDTCSDGYYFTQNFQLSTLQSVNYYTQINTVICNKCLDNCKICTSQYTCVTCQTGYFWTPTTQTSSLTDQTNAGYCQSCGLQITNCSACSNGTTCDKCADGYYYTAPADTNSKGTCTACISNCLKCSGANQCDTCDPAKTALQTLDNGSNSCQLCNQITNCLTCNYTNNVLTCLSCNSNTALDTTNNKCQACPNNCTSCSYNSSNVLQCDNCTTITQVWDATKTQCSACPSNCSRPNCKVDNGTATCSLCDTQYIWDGTQCQPCNPGGVGALSNCQTCSWNSSSSASVCQTCQTGYVKANDGSQCYKCPDNCFSCQLNSNGNAAECKQCNDTYYLTTGTCSLCSSAQTGGLRCTSNTNMTQCSTGYFLLNNSCVQNTGANNLNQCLTIQSDGAGGYQCDTCLPSAVGASANSNQSCYYCNCLSPSKCSLSAKAVSCSPAPTCLPGYTVSGNTCVICTAAAGCCPTKSVFKAGQAGLTQDSCVNDSTTQQCISSTSNGVCKCDVGYYYSNQASSLCSKCQANCDICTDNNTCTTCSLGYTLVGSTCVKIKCLDMTYYYAQDSGCSACQYGFYLSTISSINYCLQCISPLTIGFGSVNQAICRPFTNTAPNVTPTPAAQPAATTITAVSGTITSVMATSASYYCDNGYFWNSQYCSPCGTIDNGYCVCTSYKQCTSMVCNTGYSLVQNACLAIPQGCLGVALSGDGSTVICTSCVSGNTLLGNVCLPNNNCSQFNTSTGNCQSCSNGFYLNWQYNTYVTQPTKPSTTNNTPVTPASPYQSYYFNSFPTQCTACSIANCQVCNGPSVCTTCNSGYYWQVTQYLQQSTNNSQGSCQPCMQGCSTCINNQSCQTCFPGFYAVFPYSGINYCQSCSSVISQCLTCDNSTSAPHQQSLLPTCRVCQTGYSLNNNICVKCPVGCLTCDAKGACTNCGTGYARDQNSNCLSCPSNCTSCSVVGTTTSCNQCNDLYYKSLNNGSSNVYGCSLCSNVSSQNYLRCNSQSAPTQCQQGYYLNGSTCTIFNSALNCLTYNESGQCSSCLDGLIIVSNQCKACSTTDVKCIKCTVITTTAGAAQLQCAACSTGYYLNAGNTCTACTNVTGCDVCNSNGCSSCVSSYYPVPVSTDSNNNTGNGTSNNSVTCSKCPNNCLLCQQANSCTKCSDGYFLLTTTSGQTSTTQCYACQPECATCVAPGNTCTSCYTGYVFSNGGCVTLAEANCYTAGTNGCAICIYGFYLNGGICYQCLNPQADFLCTNPVNNFYTSVKTS